MIISATFQHQTLIASKEMIFFFFFFFFANTVFRLSRKPIKFSRLDKLHMFDKGLPKEHSCKKTFAKISAVR